MRCWLGVTDNEWFNYLSGLQPDEVNFWQPSGSAPFVGLTPGAPFLFKLKRPYNHVVGGGYFVAFLAKPLSVVWETFGNKNGASSFEVFEKMIRRLARGPRLKDPVVGCTILTQPFFLPRELWIPAPSSWASNIVRGRYYDSHEPEGAILWDFVQQRTVQSLSIGESSPRYGVPTLIRPRLGQGAFRLLVTEAYQSHCAITGESTLPVLEAAHIQPFSKEGPNEINNGMLLRSDFHKLFDLGLITVTPQFNVEVSSRIREEWFNGRAYYRLHGQPLASIPKDNSQRPATAFLQWHNENCYQG